MMHFVVCFILTTRRLYGPIRFLAWSRRRPGTSTLRWDPISEHFSFFFFEEAFFYCFVPRRFLLRSNNASCRLGLLLFVCTLLGCSTVQHIQGLCTAPYPAVPLGNCWRSHFFFLVLLFMAPVSHFDTDRGGCGSIAARTKDDNDNGCVSIA